MAIETIIEASLSNPTYKGEKGDKGDPGRTPVKGVDYFTQEDIDEIVYQVHISQEIDPQVHDWAKAANKPTYTASEVGAVATTAPAASITAEDIANWNSKPSADTDTDTTYSISISNNRITLTPSSGSATYIDLPVFSGGVL